MPLGSSRFFFSNCQNGTAGCLAPRAILRLPYYTVTVAVTLGIYPLRTSFACEGMREGRCDGIPVPRPNFVAYALPYTGSMSPSFIRSKRRLVPCEPEALTGVRDGQRVHGFELQDLFDWTFVFAYCFFPANGYCMKLYDRLAGPSGNYAMDSCHHMCVKRWRYAGGDQVRCNILQWFQPSLHSAV